MKTFIPFALLMLCFSANISAIDDLPPGLALDPKALISQAQEKMHEKKYAEAEELFQEALDLDPVNIEIFQSLGNAQWAQDKKAVAVKNYKRSLEYNPENIALKKWMIKMGYIDSDADNAPDLPTEPDLPNKIWIPQRKHVRGGYIAAGIAFDVLAGVMINFGATLKNNQSPTLAYTSAGLFELSALFFFFNTTYDIVPAHWASLNPTMIQIPFAYVNVDLFKFQFDPMTMKPKMNLATVRF